MPTKPKIERHTITLARTQAYSRRKSLDIQIMVSGRPDLVFYAGFGNEGSSALRIIRLLEAAGISNLAVVSPLPYWGANASEDSLRALGIDGAVAAANYLREQFSISTLHAVAESQASAALVYAATQYPEIFNGNLALLRPLGLVQMRKRDFLARMAQGAAQPEQFLDWRTYLVARHAAWRTLQSFLGKDDQLKAGLIWDIRDELSKLVTQKPGQVRVFAGADDRLFPVESMRQALEGYGLTSILITLQGGHASPAIRAGSNQLRQVIEWCRTNKYA